MLRSFVLLVSALAVSSALAADLPRRKSGLWDISVLTPGAATAMTMRQCVDEKSDDIAATISGRAKESCQSRARRDGAKLAFDSTCKIGKTTSTTNGVFTGDFTSNYAFEATTTFKPPMQGMKDGATKGTARWTGPCQAGMKPGDVIMANGTKFNINDAKFRGKK
jgi:Protein of unknown function (DUF3617)